MDICDCQDPMCNYDGIDRLVSEEMDKNNILLSDNSCKYCSKELSPYAKYPNFVCVRCKKGVGNLKYRLEYLKNALVYLCKTPKNNIYSYSFSPKEKKKIYTYLLHEQAGRCAICNIWWKDLKVKMHIDHDHINGFIRGILCTSCNMALGYFCDSTEALANAIVNFSEVDKNNQD